MNSKLYISDDAWVIVKRDALEEYVMDEFYYETFRDFLKYYSYDDALAVIENKAEIVIEKGFN
jgi:hypothetical protein